MANAKKCDRCGKLYEYERIYPYPEIKIVDEFSASSQRGYLNLEDLDLCKDCIKSFFNWIAKEQNNGTS